MCLLHPEMFPDGDMHYSASYKSITQTLVVSFNLGSLTWLLYRSVSLALLHNNIFPLTFPSCHWYSVQFWCDFDRASSLICGNKMPTRCNRGFYCRSYCLLRVMRPVCRMLQHPANRTHYPQLHTRPATWKTTAQNTTRSNHCIILLSSWWWA